MTLKQSANEITYISSKPTTLIAMLHEFLAHGELLYFLVRRTYKIRYAQAALGVAWAVLQPLLTAGILALVLGRVMRPTTDGIPPLLFFFAATVPWTFFANGVSSAATSLTSNQAMVQKIYFPRLCLPVSSVLSAAVDLVIPLFILAIVMVLYGRFDPSIETLPAVIGLLFMIFLTSAGAGAGLAALNLKHRDVQHALPFAIQILFFASPIFYSPSGLPQPWGTLYYLNPLAGMLEGFRAALLHTDPVSWEKFTLSATMSVVVFVVGLYYFMRAESKFADIV